MGHPDKPVLWQFCARQIQQVKSQGYCLGEARSSDGINCSRSWSGSSPCLHNILLLNQHLYVSLQVKYLNKIAERKNPLKPWRKQENKALDGV